MKKIEELTVRPIGPQAFADPERFAAVYDRFKAAFERIRPELESDAQPIGVRTATNDFIADTYELLKGYVEKRVTIEELEREVTAFERGVDDLLLFLRGGTPSPGVVPLRPRGSTQ